MVIQSGSRISDSPTSGCKGHGKDGQSVAMVVLSSFTVEVLQHGEWSLLAELEDPELIRLANQLPATLLQSRASSSTKKYAGAFKRWKAWASSHHLPTFPTQTHHVALYLQHLAEQTKSKSAAEEAVNALAWVHGLAGINSPTNNPVVQKTLQGLKRTLAKPVQKKKPITKGMIENIVADTNSHPSLANIRLATACLLAFSGFLRFDELIHIRACDITIDGVMAKIHIPRSKTDQFRQSSEVVIARSSSKTCPVNMVERYMSMAALDKGSEQLIFRGITNTKAGEKLRPSGGLSYTTLRELFKKKLSELGYPNEQFGLHSLHSGGATAVANAGVPDRLFKKHGRWKSENAKDGYVEDSLDSRLSVSRQIGL